METAFFSSAELNLHIPSTLVSASEAEHDTSPSRKQVYYDEELAFWLHVHLPKLELDYEQAERVFKSPALKLVAELGYLDPARPPPASSQLLGRSASSSRAFDATQHPAITPALEPQAASEDAQYASLRVAHVLWSAQWELSSKDAFKLWRRDDGWTAAFRWSHVGISFPKIPSHLLAIDVTLTFQEALDPSLPELIERPPTPPTPPSKPRRLSTGPAFPSSEYARRLSREVDLGGQSVATSFADMPPSPGTPEIRAKAARLRRRKMLEEDYAFEGLEEINLFEDLSLNEPSYPDLFLPASRFPATLAAASIAVGATASTPTLSRPRAHSRSRSQAHQRRASQTEDGMSSSSEEIPALRRVLRKVVVASSAVDVRMRTLPVVIPDPNTVPALEPTSPSSGLTLSVEIHTPPNTMSGFELQSVVVELDPMQASKVGMVKCVKQPLFNPVFPIVLDPVSQYNFLFSLPTQDILLEPSTFDSAGPEARDLPPPTPISALLSPKQTLSRRHQANKAQTPVPEAAAPSLQKQQKPPHPTEGRMQAENRRKTACIVIKGRPIHRPGGRASSEHSAQELYYTDVIESRWHTSLDVTPPMHLSSGHLRTPSTMSDTRLRRVNSAPAVPLPTETRSAFGPLSSAAFSDVPVNILPPDTSTSKPQFKAGATLPPGHMSANNSRAPTAGQAALVYSSTPSDPATARPSPILPERSQSFTDAKDCPPPPTPAFPPYSTPRASASVIQPLEDPHQPLAASGTRDPSASIQRFARDRPDIDTCSGVLVHVSLLPQQPKATEAEPTATFNPNTPVLPQAALMRPSLSAISFKSHVSSRADAVAEEMEETTAEKEGEKGTPASATALLEQERKRSHVQLFDVFLLEVFVMNKTTAARMFSIGVPAAASRTKVAEDELPASMKLGLGLQGLLPADLTETVPEAGVVALEDNVLVGPLQPGTCQSVRIRFLALRPGVHRVGELEMTDTATGHKARLMNVLNLVVDV